jgi:hypothetical protein
MVFSLLCFLSISLAFADDFQSYNAITDPSFTSNYSLGGFCSLQTIATAPSDSLTLRGFDGYSGSCFISINDSKLNLSYPFVFSATLRNGSVMSRIHVDFGEFTILFFINNTDTNNDTAMLRGYKLRVHSADTSGGYPNDTIILERFNPSSSVELTRKSIPDIDYNKDNIFIASMDSNKYIHFFINNVEILNYYDTAETYLSGGVGIFEKGDATSSDIYYLDNINSNATISALSGYNYPANWHVLGWLNNIENLPGYYQSASHNLFSGINCYWSFKNKDVCVTSCQLGLMAGCDGSWYGYWGGSPAQIKVACGTYSCDITTITYSLHGSTVTETTNSPLGSGYDDYALPDKYYDGITAYFYVLGQPFTESIRASIHILPYMRLKASAPGCYYVSPQKWVAIYTGANVDLSQYETSIPTTDNNDYWGGNYWKHDNTGDYLVSITEGFICNNSNNITVSYDFYNTQTSALLFTKDVTFPVGYVITNCTGTGIGSSCTPDYDTPFDCVFNASLCTNAGNLPIVNQTCTPGVNCPTTPGGVEPGILGGFGDLGGLVTPLTILLSAVLFFGAIVTRDTKSSSIGLIVIMAGCLILSFYNVLPWYITVLITIGAGFFILSQVRTGVFGNAQTA